MLNDIQRAKRKKEWRKLKELYPLDPSPPPSPKFAGEELADDITDRLDEARAEVQRLKLLWLDVEAVCFEDDDGGFLRSESQVQAAYQAMVDAQTDPAAYDRAMLDLIELLLGFIELPFDEVRFIRELVDSRRDGFDIPPLPAFPHPIP
jgi:hypothetical protein